MAREDIKNIVNSLETGDNVGASNAFATVMVDKQKEAIDAKRLDVQLDWLKQEQPANEEI